MAYSTLAKPSGCSFGSSNLVLSSQRALMSLDELQRCLQFDDIRLADTSKVVKHVRNPGSLGACLAQLIRAMRSAFDETSQRMIQVKALFRDIPCVITEIENIFQTGRPTGHSGMETLINQIGYKWTDCLNHTKYCIGRLEGVRKLIKEIHELSAIKENSLQQQIDKLSDKKRSLLSELSTKKTEMKDLSNRIREAIELNNARKNVKIAKSEQEGTILKEAGLNVLLGGAAVGAIAIGAALAAPLIPIPVVGGVIAGGHGIMSGVNIAEAEQAHRSAKSKLKVEEQQHEQCKKEYRSISSDIPQLESGLSELVASQKKISSLLETLRECSSDIVRVWQIWVNAEQFFQKVADHISETDGNKMKDFADTARSLLGKVPSALKTKLLARKAQSVNQSLQTTEEMLSAQLEPLAKEKLSMNLPWPATSGHSSKSLAFFIILAFLCLLWGIFV